MRKVSVSDPAGIAHIAGVASYIAAWPESEGIGTTESHILNSPITQVTSLRLAGQPLSRDILVIVFKMS